MVFLLIHGLSDWITNNCSNIKWLHTAPVVGKPAYPVILDVAESVQSLTADPLVTAAKCALAPTFEELEKYSKTNNGPRWDDIKQQESDALERYLMGALVEAVVSLGSGFGLILYHPQRFDHASRVFVERLLRKSDLQGFTIAIEAPSSILTNPLYKNYVSNFELINVKQKRTFIDINDRSFQLAAMCPQGIPVKILERLGLWNKSLLQVCKGPYQEQLAFLPLTARRIISSQLSFDFRCKLHAQIFDAWEPDGWGYLRRAWHAIASGDSGRILSQHTAYLHGIATIGREFLYMQYRALSNYINKRKVEYPYSLYSLVGAARLARRVRSMDFISGARKSLKFYQRALKICVDPVTKAELLYDIANTYATQRKTGALVQAREYYEQGYSLLRTITKKEDKLRIEIRLANGLALVEYHAGNNQTALSLVKRAKMLAKEAADKYPFVAEWAVPLINTNMAKLLEKRFSDISSAVHLYKKCLNLGNPRAQEKSHMDLASLYFDKGNYKEVIALLSKFYENYSFILDEDLELFGRSMFTISLLATHQIDRARQQLSRLVYLCNAENSEGGYNILATIQQLCDT